VAITKALPGLAHSSPEVYGSDCGSDAFCRALALGESFRGHRRDPFLSAVLLGVMPSTRRGEALGEDEERGESGSSEIAWSGEEGEERGEEREDEDAFAPRARGERGLPSSLPRSGLSGLEENNESGGLKNNSAIRVLRRAGFCAASRGSLASEGDCDAILPGVHLGQLASECVVPD
jgi:hypothetical protein